MADATRQFDFLVLGSGIAGLTLALKVAPRGVAIEACTKKNLESETR